jgi:hypothetical protein
VKLGGFAGLAVKLPLGSRASGAAFWHLQPAPGGHTVPAPIVSSSNPFSTGFRAARANLLPGLMIQAMMIALVLAYYYLPASLGCFLALAAAKARWGFGFSFVSSVIAGAILPTIFKVAVLNRGRATRADLAEMLFLAAFWGMEGVIVDALYRFQAVLFGAHPDFWTVVKKVLVDMFIYNPLFAAPYTLAWYEMKHHGYRLSRVRHIFTGRFYREKVIPALCATWLVWIPVVSALYSLPSLLQIPLFALALTFWVLMVATITARRKTPQPSAAPVPQAVAE